MQLLIIGGSGQLSGRLAQMALEQGHQVWTVTRGNRALPSGVHSIIADRSDPAALGAALSAQHTRWDAVLDCICMNPEHAWIDLEHISAYCDRFVVVSTDSVYHPSHKQVPQSEEAEHYMDDGGYGAQKRKMEEVFLSSQSVSVRWTIFRPGHIFGPGFLLGCFPEQSRQPDLLSHMRAGRPLRLVGGGELLIHPIFVDDLAQCMLDCIGNPRTCGEIFCIGGPEAIPNAEYYRTIGRIIGCPAVIEEIPLEGYLEAHPQYSGHLCQRSYTLRKLEEAGVPLPSTPLETGLMRHIAWLDAQESV
ncbi:MAG: NAD-dependent epimerase/dehydratase family protein [Clostridiales bacterium]|nr:NAD-dependent epimerase/dehydratase family protein [Clostridiales bacterium]